MLGLSRRLQVDRNPPCGDNDRIDQILPEHLNGNAAIEIRRGAGQPEPRQPWIGDQGQHLAYAGSRPAVHELGQGENMFTAALAQGNDLVAFLPAMQCRAWDVQVFVQDKSTPPPDPPSLRSASIRDRRPGFALPGRQASQCRLPVSQVGFPLRHRRRRSCCGEQPRMQARARIPRPDRTIRPAWHRWRVAVLATTRRRLRRRCRQSCWLRSGSACRSPHRAVPERARLPQRRSWRSLL